MDYFGMAKRAWEITWRYRVLWLFGFLAGASGTGGSGSGTNYSGGSGDLTAEQSAQFDQAASWMGDNLALIIGATVLIALIVLCFWIISVAARGGLVHLASQADEGIAPTVREGFTVGFHVWGRVFLIGLVIYLPFVLLMMLIMVPTVILPIIAAVQADGSGSTGGAIAAVLGMIGILIVEILVFAIVGMLLGLIEQLALRHGVLADMPAMESVRTAMRDLRARFLDVFLMWLVTLGVGFVVALVFGAVAAMFGIAVAGAAMTGLWPLAVVIGVVMMLVFIVPGAIVSAFSSTLWTVFYRRFTGRDGASAQAPVASAAQGPSLYSPEFAPQPPAPPAAPEPPTDFLPPPPVTSGD